VRFRTWVVSALLFGSGFCALVYQVGWLRDFRLIFGASTAASAAVVAIFIGGLGAGGLLLGPRADRHPRPLALYATLELIVAISAAATPLLLILVRQLYLASGGSATLGAPLAAAIRVALSAVVLAVPTLAMGGTLPAAARAAMRDEDVRRQDVAAVYALNTLGAVAGCLVATFWMLEMLGTRSTIWLTAILNTLIAGTAWLIAGRWPELAPEPADPSMPAGRLDEAIEIERIESPPPVPSRKHGKARRGATPARTVTAPSTAIADQAPPVVAAPARFLLVASGVVGFAFFLMELVWYRLLAPLLGGSVFTFGLVLAVALAGIGLGGLAYALFGGSKPASVSGFGSTCLIEAAAVAATFALGDRVAFLAAALSPLGLTTFTARIAGWTLVAAVVVLPPALIAGYQFPLLIALFGQAREAVSRQIGRAYAANTLGAIVGSLGGGFGLLPALSAVGAWRFVAVVLLVLGIAAVVLAHRRQDASAPGRVRRALTTQAATALLALILLAATGPTAVWRHSGIGGGRVGAQIFGSRNGFLDWLTLIRRNVVWEVDGTESGVALIQNRTGYAFIVNGKSDGSARNDAGTQIMSGLIGALMVPDPQRALVIGLGTGSTAGWLGAIPSIERVDVVELEPVILDVARACAAVNHGVLDNPRVHIAIGDAREAILTSRDRYDVIASEPSNPYRAGIASLFTVEYYRAVADRLTDEGVFVQWVQAYEIDTPTLQTIYTTLGTVFPQIETWHTNPGDIVLVATKRPHRYRASELAMRIAAEPYKSALNYAWRAADVRGLLAHYLANDAMARRIAQSGADLNTDDRNVVEFRLARSVGITLLTVADIRNAARSAGFARPPLDDDVSVPWPAVDTAWMSYTAGMGSFLDTRTQGPATEQARQSALIQYYRNEDVRGARSYWEQQPEGARDPTDTAMLADITAETGLEGALPFIDRLREYRPGEADVMLATLRLQQAKAPDAAAAVEAALVRFRTDPWTMTRYMDRAIQIAQIIGTGQPSLARRMFDALGQPFAVLASEEARLLARAELTRAVDFPGLCREAVDALGPHVPWAESFLRLRRDCYQATRDARLARTEADLNDFIAATAQPLITP
jgi:spermidine synthase